MGICASDPKTVVVKDPAETEPGHPAEADVAVDDTILNICVQSLDDVNDQVTVRVRPCETVAQSLHRELAAAWGAGGVMAVYWSGQNVARATTWSMLDVDQHAVVRVQWWTSEAFIVEMEQLNPGIPRVEVEKVVDEGLQTFGMDMSSLSRPSCVICLPESLGQLQALQSLNLQGCNRLTLPESFVHLINLPDSNFMKCCKHVARLPESIVEHPLFKDATELDLSSSKLVTLPDMLFGQQLEGLQTLNLKFCTKLVSVPESIGHLVNLQSLKMQGCSELESLPESLAQLQNLEELNLYLCDKLKALPDSFGELLKLRTLDLERCFGLTSLPESFWQLSNLEVLSLRGCYKLERLPETFGLLGNLKSVDARQAPGIFAPPLLRGLVVRGCAVQL